MDYALDRFEREVREAITTFDSFGRPPVATAARLVIAHTAMR